MTSFENVKSLDKNSNTNTLKDCNIVKQISTSKFPVYYAHHTLLNQEVAIKMFPSDVCTNKNYNNEKNILNSFDHPNIIKVIESIDYITTSVENEERSVSCICFEHASNGDLYEVISKHGDMPEILVRTLFHDLLEAVDYIHSNGIAHLDLKLENLLLDKDFNLKVIDFDLSQPLSSKRLAAQGTPNYRAPEIKKGLCFNLKAADIYSLGITLFVLVFGNPPYVEVNRGNESGFDSFYKHLMTNKNKFWEIHLKHKNQPNFVSEEFKDFINSILIEDPKKRVTSQDIRNSKWYQGPILDKKDYHDKMVAYFQTNI